MIYHEIFSDPTITLTNRNSNSKTGPYVWLSTAFALGLLRTCRLVYAEASPILRNKVTLVCRDNARPEQLRFPIDTSVVQGIQEVVLMHNLHSPFIRDSPLNPMSFPALRRLRIEVQVSSSDHGFATLPKASTDAQLLDILRSYVARLKERCDWLGDLLRRNGPEKRGFKVTVAVDLRHVWDWYHFWTEMNGAKLCWVSCLLVIC